MAVGTVVMAVALSLWDMGLASHSVSHQSYIHSQRLCGKKSNKHGFYATGREDASTLPYFAAPGR